LHNYRTKKLQHDFYVICSDSGRSESAKNARHICYFHTTLARESNMTIRLGVIMDDITNISVKKDSTLSMLVAAQSRGWQVYYMQQADLYLDSGRPMARSQRLSAVSFDPENWYCAEPPQTLSLTEFDVLLMRKDPPFDNEYLYTTYILDAAEREGVLIVNKPASLRDCNEKIFATQFTNCTPPLLVSRNPQQLRDFLREHQDIVMKPLDGMGGTLIFRVRHDDPNISVIIETLTDHENRTIMAQRFIPEIVQGDKRILMIDGEAVPYCLARVPAAGETRGNLAAGGSGEARPLTARDRWICEQVAPTLKEKHLLFVGLDVIGDYLTEINVTSPTCIREIDAAYGTDIGGMLMDCIATKLELR
jgi:glutathione synthase